MPRSLWLSSREGVAAVLIVAALTSFGFGTWSPEPPRWMAVYLGAVLIALHRPRLTTALLMGFLLWFWACLSLFWAPDKQAAVLSLQQYFALLLIASFAFRKETVCAAVSVAVLVAAFFEVRLDPNHYGGFGNPNFQAEFLCLSLPFVVWACNSYELGKGKTWLFVPGAGALVAWVWLFWHNESMAKYVPVAGLIALVLWRRKAWWALWILGAAAVDACLWFRHELFAWSSVHERLELWFNTLSLWKDHLLAGIGVGNFNYGYYSYQERHLALFDGSLLQAPNVYSGAAHNEYLQIGATLGVVGLVLAVICLWLVFRTRDSLGLAVVTIGCSLAAVGFPFQSASSATLFALGVGFAVRDSRVRALDARLRRFLVSKSSAFRRRARLHPLKPAVCLPGTLGGPGGLVD